MGLMTVMGRRNGNGGRYSRCACMSGHCDWIKEHRGSRRCGLAGSRSGGRYWTCRCHLLSWHLSSIMQHGGMRCHLERKEASHCFGQELKPTTPYNVETVTSWRTIILHADGFWTSSYWNMGFIASVLAGDKVFDDCGQEKANDAVISG